jgi:5-methyltetrahydropteroyltriglutamate--homocysteine methyltransferase
MRCTVAELTPCARASVRQLQCVAAGGVVCVVLTVTQLVLEYATERAGDLIAFDGKELGLGVVNPRTDSVESSEDIVRAVERALQQYPAERLFLNPDCGFGTFSSRPMNTVAVATAKLRAMADAARALRGT